MNDLEYDLVSIDNTEYKVLFVGECLRSNITMLICISNDMIIYNKIFDEKKVRHFSLKKIKDMLPIGTITEYFISRNLVSNVYFSYSGQIVYNSMFGTHIGYDNGNNVDYTISNLNYIDNL